MIGGLTDAPGIVLSQFTLAIAFARTGVYVSRVKDGSTTSPPA